MSKKEKTPSMILYERITSRPFIPLDIDPETVDLVADEQQTLKIIDRFLEQYEENIRGRNIIRKLWQIEEHTNRIKHDMESMKDALILLEEDLVERQSHKSPKNKGSIINHPPR